MVLDCCFIYQVIKNYEVLLIIVSDGHGFQKLFCVLYLSFYAFRIKFDLKASDLQFVLM